MKAVILDIEGTICPISFVRETLFPFAIVRVHDLVHEVQFPLDSDAAAGELSPYLLKFPESARRSAEAFVDHVEDLTRRDVKASYWKLLQGVLWKDGYDSGRLTVKLYDDVEPALERWHQTGIKLYIYSSGSISAQKLLLGHTAGGDLNHLFSGYFDTVNAGSKTMTSSYEKILAAIGAEGDDAFFFSDNPKEIDAAAPVMHTVWTVRPGNEPVDYTPPEATARSFDNF